LSGDAEASVSGILEERVKGERMAKYISNPREVDAFKIKEVRPHASYGSGAGGFHLHFDNGGQNNATAEMCAHMTPKVGSIRMDMST
jgi:hypothetical protein